MAETVFILGAGASRSAGAPLIPDFLDRAFDLYDSGVLGEGERRAFELVKAGINALQVAHSKARLDITNLETVFDAFEMAALVGRLGSMDAEDVGRLPAAMRGLITATLERCIALPATDGVMRACPVYESLAALVKDLRMQTRSWPAVITLNYDICVDYALYCSGVPFSYQLVDVESRDWVKLLKLHGSLNWVHCPDCGTMTAREMHEHFARRVLVDRPQRWRPSTAAETVQSVHCPSCSRGGLPLMIVPPTWAKARYQVLLQPVWAAAAAELQGARNIFVCGYSLAPTDTFFRYLYTVGSIGDADLRHFWVFNPDVSLEPRFTAFLGEQSERRFGFFEMDFGNMVRHVRAELL